MLQLTTGDWRMTNGWIGKFALSNEALSVHSNVAQAIRFVSAARVLRPSLFPVVFALCSFLFQDFVLNLYCPFQQNLDNSPHRITNAFFPIFPAIFCFTFDVSAPNNSKQSPGQPAPTNPQRSLSQLPLSRLSFLQRCGSRSFLTNSQNCPSVIVWNTIKKKKK